MAATLVQSKSGNNTSTTALAIATTSNTSTGDLVIVAVNVNNTVDRVSSITATGMTFTKITAASGLIGGSALSYVSVWYAYNVTGATTPTITINKSATASIEAVLFHYSGLISASDPIDQIHRGTGTASSVASGTTATLAQADEVVVGLGGDDWGTGQTYTVGAGYGHLLSKIATAGGIAMQDKIVSATTAVSSSMSIGSASDNAGAVVTFKILTGTVLTATQTATARVAKNITKTQAATAAIQKTATSTQGATARIIQNALQDRLISYWKLDETSGSSASDSIGPNTGTWQGTLGSQWGTGKINNGGVLNGTDNYVSMGNVLDQSGSTAFSISHWVKTTAGGTAVYTTAGKILIASPFTGYQVGFNTTSGQAVDAGKVGFAIVDNATTVARRQSTATYNDGNFHHFVITYDGSKTRAGMLIYIDGSQPTYSDSDSTSWTGTLSNSANFEIGARNGANQPFPGTIDEVGFWNRALTSTEVTNLYNSGAGLQYPFVTGTTLTSTQSAAARIAVNSTKTQTSSARIANTVTKTQTSVARIANNKTKTQSSTARIQRVLTSTQSATSRIQRILPKTQSAMARIANIKAKTQSSIARISNSKTLTQSSTARIQKQLTKAQSSIGRIAVVSTSTQSTKARIQQQLTLTQSATAKIIQANVSTFTQAAKARIANVSTKTQASVARIANTKTKTQSAISRISQTKTKTQSAISRIANTKTKTQTATARIVKTLTKTQSAISRIANTRTKTQSAIARIALRATKIQSSIARLSTTNTKPQSTKARISQTFMVTQPVTARVSQNNTTAQQATARIITAAAHGLVAWDGTQWKSTALKVWDGTTWQTSTVERWDGSAWVEII